MSNDNAGVISPVTKSRLTMLALVFLFVSPILIAWAYTAGLIDLSAPARTNRGVLVTPALDLRDEADVRILFERAALQPGEWLVAYLAAADCDAVCGAALDELKTIRSLLGYSGQRVRVLAISASGPPADPAHSLVDPAAAITLERLLQERAGPLDKAQIVFIDWRKQLVVRFDRDAPPIDIKKDLKKLLRASQIR